MTMFGGLGGYGFEAGDPNLHDKIAKLKAKRGAQSGKQRVNKFLEDELHVDPRDLPFNLDSANARMHEIMEAMGTDIADLVGNSMGLKSVVFKFVATLPDPPNGCPSCGSKTAGGWWDNVNLAKGEGDWICYDCDQNSHVAPLPDTVVKTVTDHNHGGEDWHDLNRCWTAFVKHVRVIRPEAGQDGEDVEADTPLYSFTTTLAGTEAIVAPAPEPDITKYPTGAVLRIQKAVFRDGDLDVERMYVRIGGLFDDNDVTVLDTMQPMQDLTGWTVIEEL